MWAPMLAVALLCAALAAADHKREEREAKAGEGFWVGGRYGRSPRAPRAPHVSHVPHSLHALHAPRNDRFILSSRYGKRAPARWKRAVCRCAPPARPARPAPATYRALARRAA